MRSAAFTLHHFARLPVHDPTSGFRLFSRRVIDEPAGRVGSGLHLQHRTAGEGAPARLARRRGAGAVVRAQSTAPAASAC